MLTANPFRDTLRSFFFDPLLRNSNALLRIPKTPDDFAGDLWRSTEAVRGACKAVAALFAQGWWECLKEDFRLLRSDLIPLPFMIAQGCDGAAVGKGLSVSVHPLYLLFPLLANLRRLSRFMPLSAIFQYKTLSDRLFSSASIAEGYGVFQKMLLDAMLLPLKSVDAISGAMPVIVEVTGMLAPSECGAAVGEPDCRARPGAGPPQRWCDKCKGGVW